MSKPALIVLAAVFVGLGGVWWGLHTMASQPVDQVRLELCMPTGDDQSCDDFEADAARRDPEPDVRYEPDLDHASAEIDKVVYLAGCEEEQNCFGDRIPGPQTEKDVETVRRALTEAGYNTVVVRLARDGDPARPGALIYAVQFGNACVMGHIMPGPSGRDSWLAGQLKTGGCLA
jgi:hypothetical protein